MGTDSSDYTDRLTDRSGVWWKRLLRVQAPYHWNLRRQQLGVTLDIGCGIGRNLAALDPGSLGVDHNADSVREAVARGHDAMTTVDFLASDRAKPESFDALLLAHVIEHLSPEDGKQIMQSYLPFLRPGGKVMFICPQERGYETDHTHIRWTTGEDLVQLSRDVGLIPGRPGSFPLPRIAGKIFTYNEFTLLARKAG